MKEEIKPALLKSQVRTNVETVINILKYIEVDEETMQYILEQVGMEDHATSMANHLAYGSFSYIKVNKGYEKKI